MMRIGVISDTHGLAELTQRVLTVFQETGAERIIHCGDIGSTDVVKILSALPVDYVFGNCDGARRTLAAAIEESGGTIHGDFAELLIAGKKIAVYHGQNDERLEQEARSGQWDLICTGHTHRALFSEWYGTRILNPGALQRRWEAPQAALLDLPKIDVTHFRV